MESCFSGQPDKSTPSKDYHIFYNNYDYTTNHIVWTRPHTYVFMIFKFTSLPFMDTIWLNKLLVGFSAPIPKT